MGVTYLQWIRRTGEGMSDIREGLEISIARTLEALLAQCLVGSV